MRENQCRYSAAALSHRAIYVGLQCNGLAARQFDRGHGLLCRFQAAGNPTAPLPLFEESFIWVILFKSVI